MLTQAEVIAQLKQVSADLKEANVAIGTLQTEIGKVSTDQDTLLKQIKDLQDQIAQGGTITQELIDAANEVATQAGAVKVGLTNVAAAAQSVDDKVPDPVAPPSAP